MSRLALVKKKKINTWHRPSCPHTYFETDGWFPSVESAGYTQDKTRQGKTRQGKTRQGKTRQKKTRQDKTKQDKERQDKTGQAKTRQDTTRHDKYKYKYENDMSLQIAGKNGYKI